MRTKLVKPILVESKDNISVIWGNYGMLESFEYGITLTMVNEENSKINLHESLDIYKGKLLDGGWKPYQLILISLDPDEKIEEGDLFERGGEFNICYKVYETDIEFKTSKDSVYCGRNTFWDKKYCKKVIVTQEQISEEYIKQFIEEYNKGEVKDVDIEMENPNYDDWMRNGASPVFPNPKLTNGFITIVGKEPILYTEEEITELLNDYGYHLEQTKCDFGLQDTNEAKEWFKQNKKK